jgi:stage III sporulation protein AH
MMVFKRKQIVVLSLVIMILVAGYLQYSYKKGSNSDQASSKSGEAVYVDGIDTAAKNSTDKSSPAKKDKEKTSKASKEANNFFAQAQIDKEITRSKNTDQLTKITEDANADQQTRTEAYDKMILTIDNAEKEMKVENLIRQKGYEDVFALIAEDGSIDIVVKTSELDSSQTAQIAEIVNRQANIEIPDIKIRPMY